MRGSMDSTLKETCKCGAKFEVEGNDTFCSFRYLEFLKAHKICRESDVVLEVNLIAGEVMRDGK